jgi:hypothetical protein
MADTANLMRLLRNWPDLWQHPDLFIAVYGAFVDERKFFDLANSALRVDLSDIDVKAAVQYSWERIVQVGDLAAVQAAADRFPAVGIPQALLNDGLKTAKTRFEALLNGLVSRAGRTSYRSPVFEAAVQSCRESMTRDPAIAQLKLSEATNLVARAEEAELIELANQAKNGKLEPAYSVRLAAAIGERNLRLARVYASSHPRAENVPREPLLIKGWLDQQTIDDLISWHLDPTVSPARFRLEVKQQADMGEPEELLLARLREIRKAGSLDMKRAREIVALTFEFLGEKTPIVHPLADSGETAWALRIQSAGVARLFPYAADHTGSIVAILPRHRDSRPVPNNVTANGIYWNVFEVSASDPLPTTISISCRMLLGLLQSDGNRSRDFVRLVSRVVPVRTLMSLLQDKAPQLFEQLAPMGAEHAWQPAMTSRGFRDLLNNLFHELDLDVLDDDLMVLEDATGRSVALLAKLLPILTEQMGDRLLARRRFDVVETLAIASAEAAIDSAVAAHIREVLGEGYDVIQTALELIDFCFESQSELDGNEAILSDELVETLCLEMTEPSDSPRVEQASSYLERLIDTGFLELVSTVRLASEDKLLRRNRNLAYRLLLRR